MANYSFLDGFRAQDPKDFLLREDLTEALEYCKNLWWASPEFLWQSSARCHPRLENILLLQCMLVKINDFGDAMLDNREKMLPALRAAVEVLTSCSKVGFIEVGFKFQCKYMLHSITETL